MSQPGGTNQKAEKRNEHKAARICADIFPNSASANPMGEKGRRNDVFSMKRKGLFSMRRKAAFSRVEKAVCGEVLKIPNDPVPRGG